MHFLKQGSDLTVEEKPEELLIHKMIIAAGIILLIFFGIFPQIILPHWTKLLLVFERFPIIP